MQNIAYYWDVFFTLSWTCHVIFQWTLSSAICQQQNMGILTWRKKYSCFSFVILFSLWRAPLWKGVRLLRTVKRWRMIFPRTQVDSFKLPETWSLTNVKYCVKISYHCNKSQISFPLLQNYLALQLINIICRFPNQFLF